jgi:hypothetical protein
MLVEIVVPNGSENLSNLVASVIGRISRRWGGCTATYNQSGTWLNPETDNIETEPVCTLSVDVGEASDNEARTWFDNLAQFIRLHGNQHTVYYRTVPSWARMVGPGTIIGRGPHDDLVGSDPLSDEAVRHANRINAILADHEREGL